MHSQNSRIAMVVAFYPPADAPPWQKTDACVQFSRRGAAPTPPEVDLYLDSRMVPASPIRRPPVHALLAPAPAPPPATHVRCVGCGALVGCEVAQALRLNCALPVHCSALLCSACALLCPRLRRVVCRAWQTFWGLSFIQKLSRGSSQWPTPSIKWARACTS